MKKTASLIVLCLTALFVIACSSEDPAGILTTDTPATGDTDTVKPDNQLPETDNVTGDSDTVVPTDTDTTPGDTDTVTPDNDTPTGSCDNPNVGKNCKTDTECGTCLICVNAKCAEGCQADADCANYPGTKCNTKLARCVNTTASSAACGETACPSGCCYADKGFLNLKCLTTSTLQQCGICKQGEVYMDGKQCVPAACKVGETKCQTYSSTDPNSKCFECKTGDLVCYENPTCNTGSALMLLNAKECIPAGEVCTENDTCCSGQPCIQGYCY